MNIIYVLIPVAILITAIGIYLFFWAVKTDQFEDLEKQGLSILFDDEQKDQVTTSASEAQNSNSSPKDDKTADNSSCK